MESKKELGTLIIISKEEENGDLGTEIRGLWSHLMLFRTIVSLVKGLSKYSGKDVNTILKEVAYEIVLEQI